MDENQKKLQAQIQEIMASAASQQEKSVLVMKAIADARAAELKKEQEEKSKPATESFTMKDVTSLLDEYNRKMQERFDAMSKGMAEKYAVRKVPFEVFDAQKAAHGYGYKSIAIQERMVMSPEEMDRSGIIGNERNLLLRAQDVGNAIYLASVILKVHPTDLQRYHEEYRPLMRDLGKVSTRAMDEWTAGEGLEWVPTRVTGILLDRIEKSLVISGLFRHVQMRTKTESFGLRGALPTVYYLGQYPTEDAEAFIPASTPGTGDLTLTCQDLFSRVVIGRNFAEDAIYRVQPLIEEDIRIANVYAIEDADINGDTAGTLDSGYTYALSPRLAWDGIRKLTASGLRYDVTSGSDTTYTVLDLDAIRLLMGTPWGSNLSQLVLLTSFAGRMKTSQFTGVTTLKDYGPNATILRGELSQVAGMPIVVSDFYPTNLNASGRYDGITQTYTAITILNRQGFIIGDRKELVLEAENIIETYQTQIVSVVRRAFARRYGTTEPNIAGEGYKISAT